MSMVNKKNRNILIAVIVVCIIIFAIFGYLFLKNLSESNSKTADIPKFDGLEFKSKVKTRYATQFSIYKYKGGYAYIDLIDSDKILVVPKGGKVPKNLKDDIVVIKQPLNDVYLVSTSVMALFDSLDILDRIKFVGTDRWYIDNAKKAMDEGKWINAGNYNAPDYETLINEKCQLAIENTMVLHNPEVREKMTTLGIKNIIEKSFAESHPLGRTEWIKVYGVIFDKEKEANEVFNKEAKKIEALKNIEKTGKKVAFFYVNSRGNVVTYKTNGYVPEMIRIAGGDYIFKNLGLDDESQLSTVNMSMEEFYETAKDADIIIYNCSIMAQLHNKDDLLAQSPVLKDFKAVKDGNAWCTTKSMFQQTDKMGTLIEEMNEILTDDKMEKDELDYFFRLK